MSMVGFPLLLIPLTIFNIIVFLMPGVSFDEPIVKLTLMSGAVWAVTLSDILLTLGILMLLLEVIKGARPGAKYLTDHLLSLVVCGAAAAEFVMLPRFGTSTYFLLTALTLVDFLSGIALRARRGAQATASSRGRTPKSDTTPPPEPRFDPAPDPYVPPAATVAQSVLLDRPEPSIVHPDIASHGSSPEVQSPGLQPGNSSPPSPDLPPR